MSHNNTIITTAPIGPETIHRATLSNGMRVLVYENRATVSVVLNGHVWAGAVNDPQSRTGLASMTASLLARGTDGRSFQQINETLESLAATVYFIGGRHLVGFGTKSLSEDLPVVLDVFVETLTRPTFPETELETIRGLTLTALKELEDDTRGVAHREFRRLLYSDDHPYGWPMAGTLDSVPDIHRRDVVDFYHEHYGPRDGVIVVVGDVDARKAVEELEARLGSWQPAACQAPAEMPAIPPLDGRRNVVWPMHNKSQVDIILGTLGPARTSPDYYAALLGNVVLGQLGLMGRLGHNVRDRLGLAYYAYSGMESRLGPGPWSVHAGVSPDKVSLATESVLEEIRRLREEPVSDEELRDCQDYLVGSLPLRLETNEGIAANLVNMELYGLGDDHLLRYSDLMYSVTKEQVRDAAARYLDHDVYVSAIVGPYEEGR